MKTNFILLVSYSNGIFMLGFFVLVCLLLILAVLIPILKGNKRNSKDKLQ